MIAFPNKLPHVIWKNDRLVPLSEGWLAESIAMSASRAGLPNWEYTDHVARAIAQYLEDDARMTALTVESLEQMVRKSLEGIGFSEVARRSLILPPRVSIFLPELAARAGYELMFYPLLADRMKEAMACHVRGVRLEGIRDCAKILDAAIKWRETSRRLSEEIVLFARACLSRSKTRAVELVIC